MTSNNILSMLNIVNDIIMLTRMLIYIMLIFVVKTLVRFNLNNYFRTFLSLSNIFNQFIFKSILFKYV